MRKKSPDRFALRILHFIRKEKLLETNQRVLCAVSGGLDSMVMLKLLIDLQFQVEVAHVNFGLRGTDSQMDEELVQNFCIEHQLPFHVKPIENADWERKDLIGQSIQMKARDLRYEWFRELSVAQNINRISLAHHADDQAETILLQVLRGGGMAALSGMKPKNEFYIRPLLEITKAELAQYAADQNIPWRQDASNLESKYDRNWLRNEVFPLLQESFPGFQKVLNRNGVRWQAYVDGLDYLVGQLDERWIKSENENELTLDFEAIQKHPAGKLYVLERLIPMRFHVGQVEEMFALEDTYEVKTWGNDPKTALIRIHRKELHLLNRNGPEAP